ncbi:hypothetical protein N1851_009237 [Merluccius polli]|uniref:SCAN box domain-containing protein n=1 Tax=Merluccius polli TaxID=89951 RepID=A0AA47P774_MERPO|nr:hypothetical protein N1851_009237 [Merluccius polli]
MEMEDFFASPSESIFETFTKCQLRKVAEHYELQDLAKDLKKQVLKDRVKGMLVERSIIELESVAFPTETSTPSSPNRGLPLDTSSLSFEQQMQLLKLQMEQKQAEREQQREIEFKRLEHEKDLELKRLEAGHKRLEAEQQAEQKRHEWEKARDAEQKRLETELELEKLKQRERQEERENELQRERLRLISEGKMRGTGSGDSGSGAGGNLSNMIKFLPKFNERDPDVFFSLFEGIAEEREWSDSNRILLLQTVLSGRAQDAYVALSPTERKCYQAVKDAVLRVYEQVPEFYRQRFRNWRKTDRQTYSEVARDLVSYFDRWCSAVNIETFNQLCDLVILEQFKNIVPDHLATFINEHKVKTAAEAAILADEYVLTHRGKSRDYGQNKPVNQSRDDRRTTRYYGNSTANMGKQDLSNRNKIDLDKCNYCFESGHWKSQCPSLLSKNKSKLNFSKPSTAKGQGCAAPVPKSNCRIAQVGKDKSDGTASEGGAGCEVPDHPVEGQCLSDSASGCVGNGYNSFITNGLISLVGSSDKKPVKILRDTGATETFVLESVLPFSCQSSTGTEVLIRGMGMQTMSVPLHNVELSSDLVLGEATVGVRPALPVPGVHVILGNLLAKDRVWPSGPPLPVVTTEPTKSYKRDECVAEFPEVFTACAVTRANSRAQAVETSREIKRVCPQIPNLPSALERDEFILAQNEDDGLAELRDGVLPGEKMQSIDRGYFIQDGMKAIFDRRSEHRLFSPGDQVLALLPIPGSPFRARFSGPYDIVRKVSEQDYVIGTPNRRKSSQLCHINLLKPYYSPASRSEAMGDNVGSAALAVGGATSSSPMVAAEGEDEGAPDDTLLLPRLRNSVVLNNLDGLLGHMSKMQRGLCYFHLFSEWREENGGLSLFHTKSSLHQNTFKPERISSWRVSAAQDRESESERAIWA